MSLDVGTITVVSSDKSMPGAILKNIKRPMEVKELLRRQVENMKLRHVRFGEIMATGDNMDDEMDDDSES